ncbi:MAG: hypothetical protein CR972_02290 [Candidatus Moraniibacteriota bacterium]|nr:MAG: hypothetical protein CR972_02290 [Candidatus Moranbacteria bacterium]
MKKLHDIITHQRTLYALAFIFTLIFVGVMHGYNMNHYPYYESDEGTYISQAWSVINMGEFTPYTYWYDHPPMGWVFLAGWIQMLGGDFFQFGTSVDTFRVCMLMVHIISTALIFYIVHRVTKNIFAAIFAGVIFSISPLEIYFQRRVLLDNIMIMWLLFSIAILFVKKISLRHICASGIFFALAVLTKVTAVMFGPVILGYIILYKTKISRVFRTTIWLLVSIMSTSFYILYAFLRGEFFPAKNGEHVSFIEALQFQMSRKGADVHFWEYGSDFYFALESWMNKDIYFIIIGAIIIVLSIIVAIRFKNIRFFLIAFLLYFVFLIRGGVVINFYILPLFPFFAMIVAIMFYDISTLFCKREGTRAMVMFVPFLAVCIYYGFYGPRIHFLRDETTPQSNAIEWIKKNLPNDSAVIIDSYALVDIRDPHNINDKTFPNADWFYKINRDVAIRDEKYHNMWQNFDYIALTHEMLKQIELDSHSLVRDAYRNSLPLAKWLGDRETYVNEQKFRTTNGDWAMIFRVNDVHHAQLLDSWESYRSTYINFDGANYGQVIDPATNTTTSEGQSYAMLRSAWMNDHETFLAAWLWAKNHLQNRVGDKLFSWQWKDDAVADNSNATDADEDIALALLFGYKLWDEEQYLTEAKVIINDLWEHSVIKINGRYYFLPMHERDADKWSGYLFNPSYISPAHYRIFAEVDPKHDWEQLATDSYKTLNEIGERYDNKIYLPADWYFIDKKYGRFSTANTYFNRNVNHFSFDAFRVLWRVALDAQWFDAKDAHEYLTHTAEFVDAYYKKNGRMPMILSKNGIPINDSHALSTDVGYAISMLYGESTDHAHEFFEKYVYSVYDVERAFWNEGTNYYDENWAWFGTGVFYNNLSNIWEINVFRDDNDITL